jgi:hypothetical protein
MMKEAMCVGNSVTELATLCEILSEVIRVPCHHCSIVQVGLSFTSASCTFSVVSKQVYGRVCQE